MPSHASSLSAEPGGPQVLPGEQEAQCQCCAPTPWAARAGMCLVGEHWCYWGPSLVGLWRATGRCGAAGPCKAAGAKAADLERQWERAGWQDAAATGGKGGEPRALVVPPLTHSSVQTEICSQACCRHLQTTPAPSAQHGTAAPRGGGVHPANTPSPAAPHGTAQGEGEGCP